MEAEVTKLKYESQSPARGTLFLKKDQLERSSATVLHSRSVFLFSEITGIQEIRLQKKNRQWEQKKRILKVWREHYVTLP